MRQYVPSCGWASAIGSRARRGRCSSGTVGGFPQVFAPQWLCRVGRVFYSCAVRVGVSVIASGAIRFLSICLRAKLQQSLGGARMLTQKWTAAREEGAASGLGPEPRPSPRSGADSRRVPGRPRRRRSGNLLFPTLAGAGANPIGKNGSQGRSCSAAVVREEARLLGRAAWQRVHG